MNTLHMTEEDWNQYLNQAPSPAEEYVTNLTHAIKRRLTDPMTAKVRIMQLESAIAKIKPVIEAYDREEQNSIREGFRRDGRP